MHQTINLTQFDVIDFSKGPKRGTGWKEACPTNLTRAQRNIQCINIQEAIWGTDLYQFSCIIEYYTEEKTPFGRIDRTPLEYYLSVYPKIGGWSWS